LLSEYLYYTNAVSAENHHLIRSNAMKFYGTYPTHSLILALLLHWLVPKRPTYYVPQTGTIPMREPKVSPWQPWPRPAGEVGPGDTVKFGSGFGTNQSTLNGWNQGITDLCGTAECS